MVELRQQLLQILSGMNHLLHQWWKYTVSIQYSTTVICCTGGVPRNKQVVGWPVSDDGVQSCKVDIAALVLVWLVSL